VERTGWLTQKAARLGVTDRSKRCQVSASGGTGEASPSIARNEMLLSVGSAPTMLRRAYPSAAARPAALAGGRGAGVARASRPAVRAWRCASRFRLPRYCRRTPCTGCATRREPGKVSSRQPAGRELGRPAASALPQPCRSGDRTTDIRFLRQIPDAARASQPPVPVRSSPNAEEMR